jgi:hypothetical protein
MKYAKIKDGKLVQYPYDMDSLRADNPHTIYHSSDVFAIYPTTIDALENGFSLVPVNPVDPPFVRNFEIANEEAPYCDSNGNWNQFWSVIIMPEEEIAKVTEEEWARVRQERNRLLSKSDWTQMPDSPVNDADWHPYRQALRDITLQPDPFNLIWPEPPK